MTTNKDLIISIILLFIIISYIVFEYIHNKRKNSLSRQNKKMSLILFIFSIILFIVSLIINITLDGNNLSKTLEYIINALSISLITAPFSLIHLSNNIDEKFLYTKTIVTNIVDKKILDKIKKTGINIIILTKEKTNLNYLSFKESDLEEYRHKLNENIVIKTDNLKLLNKLINKETTCFEFKNLDSLYKKIEYSRGTYDNYLRTIKYLVNTYLPIIISYIILCILRFPFFYSLILISILKIFTIIISKYLYKNIPFDIDIMERKPIEKGRLFNKQDIMFMIIDSFFKTFTLCIPYMLILAYGGTQAFANTLYYIVFIYENIFMTLSYLSEDNILKNLIKAPKNKKVLIYIISCIILTIFINFNSYFNTRNIELHNYMSCILFGFIPVLFNELIKFARYMTKKGKNKNEHKINK